MKKVGLLYDDIYLGHKNPFGHPECAERLDAIMDAVEGSDISGGLIRITPRKASIADIEAVHDPQYVNQIAQMRPGYADPDTYVSEGTYEAALYAAGAGLEAVERCKCGDIDRAFCAVRPPGHHAERDHAMGFCIFNNIAVAARYAQKAGYAKVYIVDFDAHHGNGTQHMFEDDPSVFYFSTHQSPFYPGSGDIHEKGRGPGTGYTANYPMLAGSGDRDFYFIYHDTLPMSIERFAPDIVLVSAGYDIHARDPLAQLRVSEEGVRCIVEGILSGAAVPLIFFLEGGYDFEALAESVLLTLKLLIETP